MKITNFGTTTILFDDGKDQILFDANFSRPSIKEYLFGKDDSDIDMIDKMFKNHKIDRLRAIFISHSHYDHVIDAPFISEKYGAKIYGSNSTRNVALGKGVCENNIIVFDDYDQYDIGDFKITVIPSIHSKANVFNDDLGEVIKKPLEKSVRLSEYKEGGSFDFYIENNNKKYLIHPSCNFILDRLNGFEADVLFLAMAGFSKMDEKRQKDFFDQTISITNSKLVIPVHIDNFFKSLDKPAKAIPKIYENVKNDMYKLANFCEKNNINTIIQLPRTSIEI